LEPNLGPPETVPAPTGWSITLIPGTDHMIGRLPEPEAAEETGATWSRPAPPTFEASVAVDGDRVVYSALYDKAPQVYLFDMAGGTVTQLTDDAPGSYLQQVGVQISGDWVAWMRGYSDGDIHLRNVVTGESKVFAPQQPIITWRLAGGRLAWQEARDIHDGDLYLYDPEVGSVETIAAAHGLLSFDLDADHLAWAGGAAWNEVYLHEFASGQNRKVIEDSEQNGEFVVVKGDVLAWTRRTGDRTTLVVYRLDTDEEKVIDEFGPFNPELQTDGRYLVWNRGEQETGTEVRVYDTETGQASTGTRGTWPSIDGGLFAWLGWLGGGEEVVSVRDLAGDTVVELSASQANEQPPVVDGDHVVWVCRNPDPVSSEGRGIFVATR